MWIVDKNNRPSFDYGESTTDGLQARLFRLRGSRRPIYKRIGKEPDRLARRYRVMTCSLVMCKKVGDILLILNGRLIPQDLRVFLS
jgi:hypothetical protein